MVKTERNINFSYIGTILKNTLEAVIKGKLLLSLPFRKYFAQILYFLFLIFLWIFLRFKIENTYAHLEHNKKMLNEIEVYHAQKTIELMSFNRLTKIQEYLHNKNSKVSVPEKPATIIKD